MPKKSIKDKSKVKPFILCTVVSVAVFLILTAVFSFIATKAEMSDFTFNCLSFSFVAVSSFIGAVIYGKTGNMKMIFTSIILSSAVSFVLCVLMLLIVHDIGLKTIILYVISLVSSFAGIYTVKNKKPKRKI